MPEPRLRCSTDHRTIEHELFRRQNSYLIVTFRGHVPKCGSRIGISVVHILALQRIPFGPQDAFPRCGQNKVR